MSHPNLNLNPEEQEEISDPTKVTPPISVTDPAKDPEFLRQAAIEANRAATNANTRVQSLEQELEALKRKASGQEDTPPVFVAPSKDEHWNDPVQSTVKIVKHLMDEAIRPLREQLVPVVETANQLSAQNAYGSLKNKYAQDPRFAMIYKNPEVSAMVDAIIAKQPKVDDGIMLGTLYNVMGAIGTGEIKVKSEPINGNLPPSAPPAPNKAPANNQRPLTESEKALARRYNLTEENFLAAYDTPDEVSFAQINKAFTPPPAK